MARRSNKLRDFFQKWGGILGLVVFFGIGLFKYFYYGGLLQREHRYAVGKVYEVQHLAQSSAAHATFVVQGKSYWVTTPAEGWADAQLVGRSFLVAYHPPEPERHVLYLRVPIADSLLPAPADGWEKPPLPVPAEVVR